MPTPPPLGSKTHDAPAAVLPAHFSKRQSATASEPSFMLSGSPKRRSHRPESR